MSTWLFVALVGLRIGYSAALFAAALGAGDLVAGLLTGSLSLVTPVWMIASRVLSEH